MSFSFFKFQRSTLNVVKNLAIKGIEKNLIVSALRSLLICTFLNFRAAFTLTKELNFWKFAYNFPCEKVSLSLIHWILRFCQLSVKLTFKQTVKTNDCWIFLISIAFTLAFFWSWRIGTGEKFREFTSIYVLQQDKNWQLLEQVFVNFVSF